MTREDLDLLRSAVSCYAGRLESNPEDYGVNLGLGVTYLARAVLVDDDSADRNALLGSAKRFLGRAYVLRRGHYVPLYYLAKVAMVEQDYPRARSYLLALQKIGVKRGPVAVLLGYIAEAQNDHESAAAYYQMALEIDWPPEVVEFVHTRAVRQAE